VCGSEVRGTVEEMRYVEPNVSAEIPSSRVYINKEQYFQHIPNQV